LPQYMIIGVPQPISTDDQLLHTWAKRGMLGNFDEGLQAEPREHELSRGEEVLYISANSMVVFS